MFPLHPPAFLNSTVAAKFSNIGIFTQLFHSASNNIRHFGQASPHHSALRPARGLSHLRQRMQLRQLAGAWITWHPDSSPRLPCFVMLKSACCDLSNLEKMPSHLGFHTVLEGLLAFKALQPHYDLSFVARSVHNRCLHLSHDHILLGK